MKNKNLGYWLDCDYISGACYCHENANNHFTTSDLLAKTENYGFAISHLILGAEELIKSLILIRLNTQSYFIKDEQKEELFKNHSFKHVNIRDFFKSLSDSEIVDYYESWFDLTTNERSVNKYRGTGFFLGRTLSLGAISETDIKNLEQLISHANDYKNRGFYVDHRDNWKTPDLLGKDIYQRYNELVSKLKHFIDPLFTLPLSNSDLNDFIYGY